MLNISLAAVMVELRSAVEEEGAYIYDLAWPGFSDYQSRFEAEYCEMLLRLGGHYMSLYMGISKC